MNDRHAQYILAIAEEGSISKAAEKLFITQPSLSQMLLSIEKRCGLPLFYRSKKKMTPTFAGDIYLKAIQDIMRIEKDMILQFHEILNDRAGRISFGITSSKGQYILPPALSRFQSAYPNFEIQLMEGTNQVLVEALLHGRLDFAVVNYTERFNDLEYVDLPREEMVLAVSNRHPLAHDAATLATHSISIERIANNPFIYLTSNHGVRKMTDSIFLATGIYPPKAFEVGSNTLAHKLVEQNLGITILPDNFIRYVLNQERRMVTYFSLFDAPFFRKVSICYPKAHLDPMPKSMEFFIQCIVDTLDILTKQHPMIYSSEHNQL